MNDDVNNEPHWEDDEAAWDAVWEDEWDDEVREY
jgi:hypothetical protein